MAKNIGYELRCADPIPFDMEYTRDLGYCAAKYLLAGGNAAMISMQGGHFVPVPFSEMLDRRPAAPASAWSTSRSTRYAIARRYMIRLRRDDFEDPHELAKLAATAGFRSPSSAASSSTSSPRAAAARPGRAGRAHDLAAEATQLRSKGRFRFKLLPIMATNSRRHTLRQACARL